MKQSLFNLNFILNGKVRTFPAFAYTEATLTSDSSSVVTVVDGSYKLVIPAKVSSTYKNSDGSYMLDTNLRTILDTYPLKISG